MNNTPTPRTDAESFLSRGMGIVPTLPKEVVPIAFSRTLERELAAVTEQRDGLRSGIDYASDQLTRVTEQLAAAREELADWHNAAEQVKAEYPDEVHCSCVAILRKQLKHVTEQRDRLVKTLENIAASSSFDNINGWARNVAKAALQSLNQPEP